MNPICSLWQQQSKWGVWGVYTLIQNRVMMSPLPKMHIPPTLPNKQLFKAITQLSPRSTTSTNGNAQKPRRLVFTICPILICYIASSCFHKLWNLHVHSQFLWKVESFLLPHLWLILKVHRHIIKCNFET